MYRGTWALWNTGAANIALLGEVRWPALAANVSRYNFRALLGMRGRVTMQFRSPSRVWWHCMSAEGEPSFALWRAFLSIWDEREAGAAITAQHISEPVGGSVG